MGAEGDMFVSSRKKNVMKRPPATEPPFQLSDLKKAIPPHCFKRSTVCAFTYVIRDLILVSLFYYFADTYIPLLPHSLSYLAWPLYWFCQITMLFALWVIGHDCGHQSFNEYQWISDTVGFIIYSALFTPYFSWKYTHHAHHLHTNSLEEDMVYVPKRKSEIKWLYAEIVNNPISRLIAFFLMVLVGYPLHITMMYTGRKYGKFASHFIPTSPCFTKRERIRVLFSDAGILAVVYALYSLAAIKGVTWLMCIYGFPLIGSGIWFILITHLQHTHPSVPYYELTVWDWMKGSLSTIDTDFGLLNAIFSNGPSTHVVHHFFPTMPHYHVIEARETIKPILGDYYMFDSTPPLKAFWILLRECLYVEPDESSESKGVYWYKKIM